MTKHKCCDECADFLGEDVYGMGICAKDNELHFCGSMCNIKNKEPK